MFHWNWCVCRMGILVINSAIIPESFWIIIVFEKKKHLSLKKTSWMGEGFQMSPIHGFQAQDKILHSCIGLKLNTKIYTKILHSCIGFKLKTKVYTKILYSCKILTSFSLSWDRDKSQQTNKQANKTKTKQNKKKNKGCVTLWPCHLN